MLSPTASHKPLRTPYTSLLSCPPPFARALFITSSISLLRASVTRKYMCARARSHAVRRYARARVRVHRRRGGGGAPPSGGEGRVMVNPHMCDDNREPPVERAPIPTDGVRSLLPAKPPRKEASESESGSHGPAASSCILLIPPDPTRDPHRSIFTRHVLNLCRRVPTGGHSRSRQRARERE